MKKQGFREVEKFDQNSAVRKWRSHGWDEVKAQPLFSAPTPLPVGMFQNTVQLRGQIEQGGHELGSNLSLPGWKLTFHHQAKSRVMGVVGPRIKLPCIACFFAAEQLNGYVYACVLVAQWCPTLWDFIDCSSPGSSVRETFQAGILGWVAISSSRGSFQPTDQSHVSLTAGRSQLGSHAR